MYAARALAEEALRRFDEESIWAVLATDAIEAIRNGDEDELKKIAGYALAERPCYRWRDWILTALNMDFPAG
jgi:hypothetical protein